LLRNARLHLASTVGSNSTSPGIEKRLIFSRENTGYKEFFEERQGAILRRGQLRLKLQILAQVLVGDTGKS